MLLDLRTSIRAGLLGTALLLAGCVSSGSTGGSGFDYEEAAKTRVSLGLTYLKNNNYTQAKQNLDKALKFNPRSADVQFAMAYYYQLVGDNGRAEEFYETAMDIAPDNGNITNSYGAFKCQLGQYSEAKTYFLQAIENRLYANAAQTYENLALCAQSQGQQDEAINYFNEALKHQPARPKTLFLLAELYSDSEQWDQAKRTLERYERVARVSPDYLFLSYEIAKGQYNYEAAQSYGEMLLSMFPDSAQALRFKEQRSALTTGSVRTLKSTSPTLSKEKSSNADAAKPSENRNADINTSMKASEAASLAGVSAQSAKFHVVKEGENLYRISLLHNIRMTKLQKWNKLQSSGAIIAGQKIWLVPPEMQEE